MERKPRQKKEVLLPTSLMEDIECDELDKELQLIQINETWLPRSFDRGAFFISSS